MVSSFYSDPQNVDFRTGVTAAKKFAKGQEMSKKFDSRVLEIIVHRVYRLRHGKLHNFAQNLEQIGFTRKRLRAI